MLSCGNQFTKPGPELQERAHVQHLGICMNREPRNGGSPPRKRTGANAPPPKISRLPFWIKLEPKWQPAASLE